MLFAKSKLRIGLFQLYAFFCLSDTWISAQLCEVHMHASPVNAPHLVSEHLHVVIGHVMTMYVVCFSG